MGGTEGGIKGGVRGAPCGNREGLTVFGWQGNEVRDWTHQKQKRDPKVSFCGAYGTRTRDLLRDRQAF